MDIRFTSLLLFGVRPEPHPKLAALLYPINAASASQPGSISRVVARCSSISRTFASGLRSGAAPDRSCAACRRPSGADPVRALRRRAALNRVAAVGATDRAEDTQDRAAVAPAEEPTTDLAAPVTLPTTGRFQIRGHLDRAHRSSTMCSRWSDLPRQYGGPWRRPAAFGECRLHLAGLPKHERSRKIGPNAWNPTEKYRHRTSASDDQHHRGNIMIGFVRPIPARSCIAPPCRLESGLVAPIARLVPAGHILYLSSGCCRQATIA